MDRFAARAMTTNSAGESKISRMGIIPTRKKTDRFKGVIARRRSRRSNPSFLKFSAKDELLRVTLAIHDKLRQSLRNFTDGY
jgi:hypothetical protein